MVHNIHLSELIHRQAERYGDKTALKHYDYAASAWRDVSWRQFSTRVLRVSYALLALGIGRQERIAVFSQNKPECMYVSFGGYGIRAVTTPFYPSSSGAQITYMMNDAEVRLLFVGEQQQYDVAFSVLSLCKSLERIVIFDKSVKRKETDHLSIYFDEFLDLASPEAAREEYRQRMKEANYDDMADILYTSGTTGNSKGVILTYKMYRGAVYGNGANLPLSPNDVFLNFLPFTHIFERGWSYLGFSAGVCQAINERPADVLKSMQEIRPTCMSSVPRLWEKIYQGVQEKIAASPKVQRSLMKDALETGMRYWADYASQHRPAPIMLKMKYKFYDRTVYKLLRKTLGLDRANFFPTAGAAVSPEVEKFAHAVGLYMLVGYGLTESTATVSNDRKGERSTLGSVGQILPGLEVKIGANNEILLRGDTITPGYYKKESATKEVLDADGWFHTGDAGYMKDGELFLTERIKDLFKTSNGKYIAPQQIESKMTIDRYIDQCVVVANERKFVSALIVPDFQALEAYANQNGIAFASHEELCRKPEIVEFLRNRIDTLQQDLSDYERIKHFILLPTPFSVESGELTNTLKVKRNVVYKRYADMIDQLYRKAEQNFKP